MLLIGGKIIKYHDSWVVIYHDCENYHDCHVMLTFSRSKQATVDKFLAIHVNVPF